MVMSFLAYVQDPLVILRARVAGGRRSCRPKDISYTDEDNKKSPVARRPPGDFSSIDMSGVYD
jgi:hypothetical protein